MQAGLNYLGSFFWSSANALIRALILFGVIKQTRFPARVISVGNLQVGGSGKTPIVAQIAREGIARGMSVCILIRGYRGRFEKKGGLICPGDVDIRVSDTGDEAALLHELVPQAMIGIGADRVASYARAKNASQETRSAGFDLIILDDGLQHFKIARDLDVIAITSKSRFQVLHRDFSQIIARKDLVVWTKGKKPPRLQTPWVRVNYALKPGTDLIWLVTGVADPAHVEAKAMEAGYKIQTHRILPDHAICEQNEAIKLWQRCVSAGCKLAMTGKDFVKWKTLVPESASIIVLEPEVRLTQNQTLWNQRLWGENL